MNPKRVAPWAKADRDLLRSALSSAAKIVVIVIIDEMRGKGRVPIGTRRLARETHLSTNTVVQAVKAIESSGVLVVERRGRGQRTTFRLPPQSVAETTTVRAESVVASTTPGNSTGVARTETGCLRNCDTSVSETATRPYQTSSRLNGSAAKPRPTDPIWDTVCELWNLTPAAKSDRTRIGKIVRDLKAKGATPQEIRDRRDRYIAEWPKVECTPEAFEKHWARFAPPEEAPKPWSETLPACVHHVWSFFERGPAERRCGRDAINEISRRVEAGELTDQQVCGAVARYSLGDDGSECVARILAIGKETAA